jgi:hypothetical protein
VVGLGGRSSLLFSIDLSETRRYLRRIDEIPAGRRGASSRSAVARRAVKTLSLSRDSPNPDYTNLPVVFGIPRACHTNERISVVVPSISPRARGPIYRDHA